VREEERYRGRLLRLVEGRARYPDGREGRIEVVRHPGVAAVVARLEDGRVLLLRQYRPAVEAYVWEIPAGVIETGETPEACARRELEEETGYRAGELERLGEILADAGFTDERIHLFSASALVPTAQRLEADEATLEVHPLPIEQAYRMLDHGEIQDAATVIGLLLLRARP